MAHRFSKRHGQPSRREQKLREEQHRREFERAQQKRENRDPSKAREVITKEELK
jgi:hypothetical protein